MTDGEQPPSASTPWIWALAVVPVLAALAMQPALVGFLQVVAAAPGTASDGAVELLEVGAAVDFVVMLLLIAASGLLARLDHRRLRTRIDRPFPWGWGFLMGVYLVGRTVVVRRRLGHGVGPLVLGIVLLAVGVLVLLVEFGVIVAVAITHTSGFQ